MITKSYKQLAEVAFPIAAVSRLSAREKFIRPSTLHPWWARRSQAAMPINEGAIA